MVHPGAGFVDAPIEARFGGLSTRRVGRFVLGVNPAGRGIPQPGRVERLGFLHQPLGVVLAPPLVEDGVDADGRVRIVLLQAGCSAHDPCMCHTGDSTLTPSLLTVE